MQLYTACSKIKYPVHGFCELNKLKRRTTESYKIFAMTKNTSNVCKASNSYEAQVLPILLSRQSEMETETQ